MEQRDHTGRGQAELLQLALEAGAANDGATTIAWLREATARSDASGAAHYLLGAEYAQSGMMPEAIEQMERALALDRGLSVARIQLALMLIAHGDAARARVVLAPLAEDGEQGWLYRFGLGLTLLSEDKLTEAAVHLRAGVAANTVNPPLNDDMRKLLARLDQAQPGVAPAIEQDDGLPHMLLSAYTGNVRFNGH